jgi:hypothetical protein
VSDSGGREIVKTGKGVLDDFFRQIAHVQGVSADVAALLQRLYAGDSLSKDMILEELENLRGAGHEDETG